MLLIPVVDAAHKGRDEKDARFGARPGLSEREQQRQVAVYTALLQLFGSANALPGGGELN